MKEQIIFYDGNCILCNGLCSFLLERIDQHNFYFASLSHSKAYLDIKDDVDQYIDSVIFKDGDKLWFHSDAVLLIFKRLSVPWRFFYAFRIIPKAVRDYIYRLFARQRYSLFGAAKKCKLYSSEQRARILQ